MTEVIQAGTAVISMQEYDELRSIRAGIEARVEAGRAEAEQAGYDRAKQNQQSTVVDVLDVLECNSFSAEKFVLSWSIKGRHGYTVFYVKEAIAQRIMHLHARLHPKPVPVQKKKPSWFTRLWR